MPCCSDKSRVVVVQRQLVYGRISSILIAPHENSERWKVYASFPTYLLRQPYSTRICWQCKSAAERRQTKCATCRLARFCSPACQALSWREHKKQCGTLRDLRKTYGHILTSSCSHSDDDTTWTWNDEVLLRLFGRVEISNIE